MSISEKLKQSLFKLKLIPDKMHKFKKDSLSAFCNNFKLSDEANVLLKGQSPSTSILTFLQLLLDKGYFSDAVNFFAHGLPKRESIWWAYCAVMHSEEKSENKDILHALQVVKDWVYLPSEELRRKAETISEKLQFKTASGWLATAVFWSGGSLCKVHEPQVLPAENLYAKAVSGCVMLAAVLNAPSEKVCHDNYRWFLLQGVDIACGGNGAIT